jgi:hypothetical protein
MSSVQPTARGFGQIAVSRRFAAQVLLRRIGVPFM